MEPAVVKEQHLLIIQIKKKNICDYMKSWFSCRALETLNKDYIKKTTLMIITKFAKDYY